MITKENLDKLKDLIAVNLDDCSQFDYPHVCNMASNAETRPVIEDKILAICKASGVSVQEAILQVERAYNPNFMED